LYLLIGTCLWIPWYFRLCAKTRYNDEYFSGATYGDLFDDSAKP